MSKTGAKKPIRVLLVEDSADDEMLTMLALKKSGLDLDVTVARDGVEALELVHGG